MLLMEEQFSILIMKQRRSEEAPLQKHEGLAELSSAGEILGA